MNMHCLDHPVLNDRYFFPRPERLDEPYKIEVDGFCLNCYYHAPQPKAKTLVYFHGNGETAHDYLRLYGPIMEEWGFNYFLAEYRGYGGSEGEPAMTSMLDDVSVMIRSLGLAESQMVFFGRSVGSIYALEAAARFPGAAGLVLESGIADVLERIMLRIMPYEIGCSMEEIEEEIAQSFNHEAKIKAFGGPKLILHTRFDGLVNLPHAEQLYRWAAEPKQLEVFEKGDHNSIFFRNRQHYLALFSQFLTQLS